MEVGQVSSSPPFCASCFLYGTVPALRLFFVIHIALSAYPACLSQHFLMTTIVQDIRILSTSILIQHPSHKSPPPPLFHHNISSFHSFSYFKKRLKIYASKTKNTTSSTTSPLVCNCIMEIHELFSNCIKIPTSAIAS